MVDETRVSNETAAGPASTNAAYRIVLDAITTGSASIANSVVPSDRRLSLQPIPPLSSDEWTALGEAGGSILVDHDLATRKVKLRLVPGVVHNLAAGTLLINLDGAFQTLGIRGRVSDLGAKRIPITSTRSKEADGALVPQSRLSRGLNVPSLIVEVGVSEHPDVLKQDAKDWLTSERTGGWVRGVLAVSIEPHLNRRQVCQITMRLYTARRRLLRSNTGAARYRIQVAWTVVWRVGEPWPAPLSLPARSFLDLLSWPEGLPEDAKVEIEQEKMTRWAETLASVWEAEASAQTSAASSTG